MAPAPTASVFVQSRWHSPSTADMAVAGRAGVDGSTTFLSNAILSELSVYIIYIDDSIGSIDDLD